LRFTALVLAAASLLLGAAVTASGAPRSTLGLVRVARVVQPVFATAPTSEPGRLYIVELPGKIVVLEKGRLRTFLDIRSIVRSGGEQGLLSLAFDPAYSVNHFFYVDYTDRNGDTRVVRYRSNGAAAVLRSAKPLLFVKDFAPNHNGGQLQFGPDGRLYWGDGDGGGEGDPYGNGQNLTRPFGKIESLDVRGPRASPRLVAYGLRNPWRFSFDRATGDLYLGDVGQNRWEEVDFLGRGSTLPANFGWKRFEGLHLYDPSAALLPRGGYVPPIVEYPHSQGCSVTGGYVYRGRLVPDLGGRYLFGDFCSGAVWSLQVVDGKAADVRREPFTVRGLSSFGEDAQGELYVMSVTNGSVYRLQGTPSG
jgi:glucose/arabinose dehydrogenase